MIFCDISSSSTLSGRLGNNLFKIAACISLAKDNDVDCFFSKWSFDIFETFDFNKNRRHLKIEHHGGELGFEFHPIQFKDNMDITGYFQSEKYFLHNEEFIRRSFTPKSGILNYISSKYDEIISHKHTASIHVRRGDYLCNGNYAILDMSYYNKAIKNMIDCGVSKFIVFSDDISWCKKSFSGNSFVFIENEEAYVDLFLMSMCKNHIIANSSFSWWGAWLNPNKNKLVICPNDWFSGSLANLDKKDLIPDKWKKI